MLLNTPFSAVTNAVIAVCAAVVLGVIVRVVGVLVVVVPTVVVAETFKRSMLTPEIAPLATLLELVAAKPLTVKFASSA